MFKYFNTIQKYVLDMYIISQRDFCLVGLENHKKYNSCHVSVLKSTRGYYILRSKHIDLWNTIFDKNT